MGGGGESFSIGSPRCFRVLSLVEIRQVDNGIFFCNMLVNKLLLYHSY